MLLFRLLPQNAFCGDAFRDVVNASRSIGHPPHSSASPVELHLRVGPRALSGKKKEVRVKGVLKSVPLSVRDGLKGKKLGVR